ncbi:RWP-RK domain-containing protein [Tieghemostelium lacteum]|uniref:RWP-RK domain-containing protein n=1 Tax=Tieghemostelium lacteum TaxID=361077 RepID=A0A151ZAX4_TIELA|nr:RWP-RK domain-containing protein [Tieghemostelium lacteum]|eukprot:KYQ91097.1 RWP-RK domain-containing protein [Tieghemostelium lacteum]
MVVFLILEILSLRFISSNSSSGNNTSSDSLLGGSGSRDSTGSNYSNSSIDILSKSIWTTPFMNKVITEEYTKLHTIQIYRYLWKCWFKLKLHIGEKKKKLKKINNLGF